MDWNQWLAGESATVPKPNALKRTEGDLRRGALLTPEQRARFVARFGGPEEMEILLGLLEAHAARISYESMTDLQLSPAHVEWNRARLSTVRQIEDEIRRMVREAVRLAAGPAKREVSSIPNAGRRANPDLFKAR